MTRYAIQGGLGSFHHAALDKYIQTEQGIAEEQLICCESFRQLAETMETSTAEHPIVGVMAIENSSVGSLLYNYNLIQQKQLRIVGETYMHIEQNLLVNPKVSLEHIREVHSHPIALQQCMNFLSQHSWKIVETEDTAMSAERIQKTRATHTACIAGKLAAKMYGLDVLVEGVNDFKNNYTRFLVVTKDDTTSLLVPPRANKASIQFYVENEKGCLARVLANIADCNINLSKLQSFAMSGTYFEYYLHADLDFSSVEDFYRAIELITPMTHGLAIYGIYEKGI